LPAFKTSDFNPWTYSFNALMSARNALTMALPAELPGDFFLAAGRFLAAGFAAFFLTTGRAAFLLTAFFVTAGFDAFFFAAGAAAFFFAATFFFTAGFLALGFDFTAFFAVAIIKSPHVNLRLSL
jgi:hypothetical protein